MEGGGNGGVGTPAPATAGCNNNWSAMDSWLAFQWDVTKTLYLGVEGIYDHLNSRRRRTTGADPGRFAAGFGSATAVEPHELGPLPLVSTGTSCPDRLIKA